MFLFKLIKIGILALLIGSGYYFLVEKEGYKELAQKAKKEAIEMVDEQTENGKKIGKNLKNEAKKKALEALEN